MNFFRNALLLRGRLTGWRTWILLALLPLITFGAARLMPPEEVSAPVQVGVVLPEQGGEDFWARLERRSGLVVAFHRTSRSQAERQVAAGRWDCALVLPEDFAQRLARLETAGLFTLLIGPGSTVYPMVRETVSACTAECVAPGMAEEYLRSILGEGAVEPVRPRLEETLLDQDRVLVTMETADGAPLDPLTLANSGVSRLSAGLTAILLLLWAMLAAMDLGRWLDSPFARRLAPLRGRTALLLPRLTGELVPALLSGMLALLAVEDPLPCMGALVPYLLFWGAAALVLARWRPGWNALPVLLPFVPALGLLLSPVLLDLSVLFPGLGPVIRWTPITLYLRACDGSVMDGLLLAAVGVAVLGLSAAADHRRRSGGAV